MEAAARPRTGTAGGSPLGAIAGGVGLGALAATVALRDPGSTGWYPPCVFHTVTGLWCPACGLTRGTHELLTGDVPAALGQHLFTPVVVVAIASAWLAWMARSIGRTWRWHPGALSPRATVAVIVVAVVFGVLRNLPIAPLDGLAPD